MNQDDVIRLAEQSGAVHYWHLSKLEAFAKLVEKHKCEELAKKIEAMPFGTTGESFAVWIREQA